MSKFTSGEWNVTDRTFSLDGQSADWHLVYSPEQAVGFIGDEADAKLIAAAPEMYELVKDCARTAPPGHYTEALLELQDKARALLARLEKEGVEE